MADFVDLTRLYKQLPGEPQEKDNAGIGHFNIIKVEDLIESGKPKHTNYSRRSFYKVSLVEGDCIVHYAERSIGVKQYGLVFTNPTVPYKWEIVSQKQQGYVCVFNEAFANFKEYPVFSSVKNAVILLSEGQYNFFRDKFAKMQQELFGEYTYKYDFLRSLLTEVIHEAQKIQPESGITVSASNAGERIFILFKDLLDRHLTIADTQETVELRTPSDYAQKLNIHINHLNKTLKEITGQTTSQLIKERLLQEAKTLLKTTNWTITEIANSLGFEEPNHFSIFFKQNTSVTPGTFRKGN